MSQSLNLKELERLAFRRTHQDGLNAIALGGVFTSYAVFAFTIFPGSETESLTMLLYLLIGLSLTGLIFWLGKKFITLPRIGLVNFGPARQKRKRDLFLALAVIVAVQVVVVLLQFSILQSPALREWLTPILGQTDNNSLMLAVVVVIFVSPGMLAIAYLSDIPHSYYHATVVALALFLMILLDSAWWMVLGGVLIVLPGLVQFVLFLQRYPLVKNPDERL